MSDKLRVLFLCVNNSARSQMAEALLRARAGDRYEVWSAGSMPTQVHPLAISVLRELGIDVSQQHSKNVSEFLGQPFDYVITLCAEEVCPVFPGAARRLHWNVPDPSAVEGTEHERLQAFRQTAVELQARLDELIRDNAETIAGRR